MRDGSSVGGVCCSITTTPMPFMSFNSERAAACRWMFDRNAPIVEHTHIVKKRPAISHGVRLSTSQTTHRRLRVSQAARAAVDTAITAAKLVADAAATDANGMAEWVPGHHLFLQQPLYKQCVLFACWATQLPRTRCVGRRGTTPAGRTAAVCAVSAYPTHLCFECLSNPCSNRLSVHGFRRKCIVRTRLKCFCCLHRFW